ncbi:MAG: hypothetical protein KKC85_19375, partial [Gammaproteobacteria bacterium]|nr:hypothetical protein [Gammaproteobacteria bacterium]
VGYNATVAKCQSWARGLPFRPSGEHDVAIGALALASAVAIGTGPVDGIYEVFYLGWVGAGWYGFREWVYTPERQAWHARQETVVMNCMAREGYGNLDPSVQVTWKPFRAAERSFRLTGRDTYNAEQYAKAQRCAAVPIASMVSKGPGYETYTVACDGGATLTVRCEFGHCRSSQPVALLTPDRRRLP